jgi:long-chain acyl-CoA synthetase
MQTIGDLFQSSVELNIERALMYKRAGQWVSISSGELRRRVAGVAHGLLSWGIAKGDRVAILSENRPEWMIADLAVMSLGAVTVPIYHTLTPEQIAWLLRDCEARALFLSSAEQLQKFCEIRAHVPVERVITMDPDSVRAGAEAMGTLMERDPNLTAAAFEARMRAVQSGDLATIIYTSGTTGDMKGVMLTHGNLISNEECSLAEFDVGEGDRHLSFLPLSHVTARHVDLGMLHRGVTIAYCLRIESVPDLLQEIRPTIFVAVPRLYEKVKDKAEQQATGMKRRIMSWALQAGRRHIQQTLAGEIPASLVWEIADRLVFSKVKRGMGGEVRIYISGGAPLGRDLAEWFACVGIRIHEGYGLTETSPVIAVNTPKAHKLGTVGKPLPNLEVRIASDGEILVHGPSVFSGYWNLPQETREAFVDGWFATGDIGYLDSNGFLSVTDRKKNLIKTSGGKFIAPQPIEARLKLSPFVEEAIVLGDRRKFPCVVIVPAFAALEAWARSNALLVSDRGALVQHPDTQALYHGIVEKLNETLAQFEKLKKILVLPQPLSMAEGTLTPSMKLRRRAIEERYKEEISRLYSDVETQTVS